MTVANQISLIALSLIPPTIAVAQQAGQPGAGSETELSRIDADYQQQRARSTASGSSGSRAWRRRRRRARRK